MNRSISASLYGLLIVCSLPCDSIAQTMMPSVVVAQSSSTRYTNLRDWFGQFGHRIGVTPQQTTVRAETKQGSEATPAKETGTMRAAEGEEDKMGSKTEEEARAKRALDEWFSALAGQFGIDSTRADALNESLDKAIKAVHQKQQEWKVSVAVGLDGDEVGNGDSRYEISNAASIERGWYPRELRFKADTDITLENGSATEDVTTLLVNYDYHVKPYLEIYGFVERFTDDFMNIQQRYEAGAGFQLGKWCGGTNHTIYERGAGIETFPVNEARDWVRASIAMGGTFGTQGVPDLATIVQFLDDVQTTQDAIKDRSGTFFVGMAFSAFIELEQSEFSVAFRDSTEDSLGTVKNVKGTFHPPGENQLRLVARPTLAWRATSTLTFNALSYFKWGLKKRNDFRVDGVANVTFAIEQNENDEGVSIVVSYEYRHDSDPPQLDVGTLTKLGYQPVGFETQTASATHETMKLMIKVDI